MLCGTLDFIHRARRARKMLGGGMRQAGILASAGIVSLEQMVDRLSEDHHTARELATGLADIPGIDIDPAGVQTNLVYFALKKEISIAPAVLLKRLDDEFGIKIGQAGPRAFRAVTHYWISPQDIETALKAFRAVLEVR